MMVSRLLVAVLTLGCILTGVRLGWAQGDPGALGAVGNLGTLGALGMGMGGGEAMPGAILVKIRGEVLCLACTPEEMGVEEAPGNLYQFSQENAHRDQIPPLFAHNMQLVCLDHYRNTPFRRTGPVACESPLRALAFPA